MKRRIQLRLVMAGLGVIAVLGTRPAAAWVVVPPRAGQVGIGVQGQLGSLLDSPGLGKDYESGAGIAVRLRYRMRYERGIGLSFESQHFATRRFIGVDQVGLSPPDRLGFFTAGPEIYQMFGTRTKTHKMVSVGVGLAKIAIKLEDGETAFLTAGDGVYASAGAGLEHFFWQSWALDLSTRYMAVFHDGKPNHDLQVSLGFIFYASY